MEANKQLLRYCPSCGWQIGYAVVTEQEPASPRLREALERLRRAWEVGDTDEQIDATAEVVAALKAEPPGESDAAAVKALRQIRQLSGLFPLSKETSERIWNIANAGLTKAAAANPEREAAVDLAARIKDRANAALVNGEYRGALKSILNEARLLLAALQAEQQAGGT